MITGR